MGKTRNLLSRGSDKLGESIFGWSIPAVQTCPGRTSVCESTCYATHGRFVTQTVQRLMDWRYTQARKADFVERMCEEVFRRGVLVLRVHVAGDFNTSRYIQKWIEIAARCDKVRLFAYSRSWRVEKLRPLLYAFGALPNVRLWLSADRESRMPQNVPSGIRVAWLQDTETPPQGGDLTFQVRRLRRMSLSVVAPICANETPQGRQQGVNCSSCGICWRE